ncbi:MAG TPA: hypothetical protein VFI92_05375, partial [Steroidobacteraceae bacterium]|nr:hypothetical protein [Steroidobacteraceae bacterium]
WSKATISNESPPGRAYHLPTTGAGLVIVNALATFRALGILGSVVVLRALGFKSRDHLKA